MEHVSATELVTGRGVAGDPRYFTRAEDPGKPLRRQVTIIGQEQMATHAATLGLMSLPLGCVRANIETSGIEWRECVGRRIRLGQAVLEVQELRTPCAKMDAVVPGLRAAMDDGRQGVIAAVVQSGRVATGDAVAPAD